MKPLDHSLTTSIFSLGKGDHAAARAMLPSDALVIVIQNYHDAISLPSLLQWHDCHHYECESLPVVRRKAEKAYALQAHFSAVNVAG